MKIKNLVLAALFFMPLMPKGLAQETDEAELEYRIDLSQDAIKKLISSTQITDSSVEYQKVPLPLRESAIQANFTYSKNLEIIQLTVDDQAEEGICHVTLEIDPEKNKIVNYYQSTTGPEGTIDVDIPESELQTRNMITDWQNTIAQTAQNSSPALVSDNTVLFYSILQLPNTVLNEELYRMPRPLFAQIAPVAEKNTFSKTIKLNDKSPASAVVKQIQTMLVALGYNSFGNITGVFDAKTSQAVQQFQTDNSLINQNGTVDEETWNALGVAYIRDIAKKQ